MDRIPIPDGLYSLHCIVLVHLKYHRRGLYRRSSSVQYFGVLMVCDISAACAIKCILDVKADYRSVFLGFTHCFVLDFTICGDSICCWSAVAKAKLVVRYGVFLFCVFLYAISNNSLEIFSYKELFYSSSMFQIACFVVAPSVRKFYRLIVYPSVMLC